MRVHFLLYQTFLLEKSFEEFCQRSKILVLLKRNFFHLPVFSYELSFVTLLLNDNPQATLVDISLAIKLNPEIDNVTDVEIVFTFTVVWRYKHLYTVLILIIATKQI